ncbi:hypothetical protein RQP46_004299 [Phenoliferia psychrophenolica]
MGICSDRFITSVPEHLICPVCYDVLDDPHAVCREEHIYCKACVGNADDGLSCVNKESGCSWTGPVSNEKAHGLGCVYRDVACPNSAFGCDVRVHFRSIATHIKDDCNHETAECPRGGVDCGGPGEGWYQRSAPEAHDDVCLKWK